MKSFKPPKYVKFENSPEHPCCLELDFSTKTPMYYRAAGRWAVDFEMFPDGRIQVIAPMHKQLHGKFLVECTRLEWANDNKGYI